MTETNRLPTRKSSVLWCEGPSHNNTPLIAMQALAKPTNRSRCFESVLYHFSGGRGASLGLLILSIVSSARRSHSPASSLVGFSSTACRKRFAAYRYPPSFGGVVRR